MIWAYREGIWLRDTVKVRVGGTVRIGERVNRALDDNIGAKRLLVCAVKGMEWAVCPVEDRVRRMSHIERSQTALSGATGRHDENTTQ